MLYKANYDTVDDSTFGDNAAMDQYMIKFIQVHECNMTWSFSMRGTKFYYEYSEDKTECSLATFFQ